MCLQRPFHFLPSAILFMALFMMSRGSSGQVTVTHMRDSADLAGRQGLIYALPRTFLRIQVYVTKVQELKGPHADFASEMLGLEDVIMQNKTSYDIDNMTISSFTEPDPERFFFVEMANKADKQFAMVFSESGLLMGVGRFDDEAEIPQSWGEELFTESTSADFFSYYSKSSMVEDVDTIKRIMTIDTITIEEVTYKINIIQKTEHEKAREAAARVRDIRLDKYNLLIGYQETAYEKEALKYMMDKLGDLEMEYLSQFTGIRTIETIKYTYFYTPKAEDRGASVPLIRFSADNGPGTVSGDDILIKFAPAEKPAFVSSQDAAQAQLAGYAYCIPEMTEISVSYPGRTFIQTRMLISQFGPLMRLPSNVVRADFHPTTGALKKVVLEP